MISVIDTGVGIPKENLDRIFNHGFTTRPDGHGFGLHSARWRPRSWAVRCRPKAPDPAKAPPSP